jgi:hypothetical protein
VSKPTGLAAFAGKAAPKATDLNKYSLFEHMKGEHAATNAVEPTSSAGIRRAMKAGLVKVEGKQLVLTDEGKKEQQAFEAKEAPARVSRTKNRLAENENILKIAERDGRADDAAKARVQVEKWKVEVAKAEAIHAKHGGKSSSSEEPKASGGKSLEERFAAMAKDPNFTAMVKGSKKPIEKGELEAEAKASNPHVKEYGAEERKAEEMAGPTKISTEEKKADPKLSKLMQAHDDAYMRAKYAGSEAEKKQGEADLAEHKARISKHVAESHKAEASDEPAGGKDSSGKPLFDKPPSAEALALMGKDKDEEKEMGAKMRKGFAKEEKDYAAQKTQTAQAGNMFTKQANALVKQYPDEHTKASQQKQAGQAGQSIQTGAKGGRYYVNASGTKVYVK